MSFSALLALAVGQSVGSTGIITPPQWGQYGGNPQHTALSQFPSKPMSSILWSITTDFAPQYSGGDLLTHYGSPEITALGTIIVPIKTGATDGFLFSAITPDGFLKWLLCTHSTLPTS